jgi:hypothetical protein
VFFLLLVRSSCYDTAMMRWGEQWGVKANYDLSLHPPMLDVDGMSISVTGISLVYVA